MRYIMNSAVIPGPGVYRYRIVQATAARAWIEAGPWESRVGSGETARYIDRKLHAYCPLSREITRMKPGDQALVVRLNDPPQDPSMKRGTPDFSDENWELGLLERIE